MVLSNLYSEESIDNRWIKFRNYKEVAVA